MGFALLLFVFTRQAWRNAAQDPKVAPKLALLHAAFGGRQMVVK
jgi:cytochrome b561